MLGKIGIVGDLGDADEDGFSVFLGTEGVGGAIAAARAADGL